MDWVTVIAVKYAEMDIGIFMNAMILTHNQMMGRELILIIEFYFVYLDAQVCAQ
jgi:hypothetical protein